MTGRPVDWYGPQAAFIPGFLNPYSIIREKTIPHLLHLSASLSQGKAAQSSLITGVQSENDWIGVNTNQNTNTQQFVLPSICFLRSCPSLRLYIEQVNLIKTFQHKIKVTNKQISHKSTFIFLFCLSARKKDLRFKTFAFTFFIITIKHTFSLHLEE